MKIGILGTRGIPNYHGGFEQFTEFFATFLVSKGHEVYVYSSHSHPYQEATFKGVHIIHCKDPEDKLGTVGQFFYDLNCILDARKRSYDILLQLGYTSNSVWFPLLPSKPLIITNMDGLEWKRSKYNKWVRKYLKYAEKWAVRSSDYLISDSIGIQKHLQETYNKPSQYIAYGATLFNSPDSNAIATYNVNPGNYNMLIARMEPENNIEVILDGVAAASNKIPFLVIGKNDVNSFGKYLTKKYENIEHIRFIGGVYNLNDLNNLRFYSNLYFHGHSVGGTNPSLLEAMASNALIVAHENEFNSAILNKDAFYFTNALQVQKVVEEINTKSDYGSMLENNKKKVIELFSWNHINQQYLDFFSKVHEGTH